MLCYGMSLIREVIYQGVYFRENEKTKGKGRNSRGQELDLAYSLARRFAKRSAGDLIKLS